MVELEYCLPQVVSWVQEVGAIQLAKLKEKNLKIESKSSVIDLVTEVDKLSEAMLLAKVRESFPEHSILAEEGGAQDNASDYRWVIDPLDGTINYAHGFPIFCISVALQYRDESVLGVVHVPALAETYTAVKDGGAFLNGGRLQVSETTRLNQALLATGFPYDRAMDPDNNLKYFNYLLTQVQGIRRAGSAAFDLCNVAAGRFDGYWEFKLKPWDVAAGTLMVTEAGGVIDYLVRTQHQGLALIAANPKFIETIKAELEAADYAADKCF
ncbi:MAG TPA: inositol monophosphatase family protein [Bacillota bacterium]|nr:inositol monophosphatase family protein [Bacillota bacterium]